MNASEIRKRLDVQRKERWLRKQIARHVDYVRKLQGKSVKSVGGGFAGPNAFG